MSRVRITIGRVVPIRILIALAVISMYLSVGCPDLSAQTPPKLAVAQGHNWRTYIFATNNASAPVHLDFGLCLLPGSSADLEPGESFRLDDVGTYQCTATPTEFYLLDAIATAHSLLAYDDGKTSNSYDVPPLGTLQPGGWMRIAPVSNDENFTLTLNTFESAVRIVVDFFDAKNRKIGTEFCDSAEPVTQCVFKTQLRVGSIELTTTSFQGTPRPATGFAAVTNSAGHNARIYPFPLQN